MDHLVKKELAEWLHSKSCGQWLNVQWRSVTSGIPQELVLGLELFTIFVSDMDSGTECTLGKFVNDMKLCGTVDTLEGWDAIQWDLNRAEMWACAKLMKFKKAKCKVLHVVELKQSSEGEKDADGKDITFEHLCGEGNRASPEKQTRVLTKSTGWTIIGVDLPNNSLDVTINHMELDSEYFVIWDTTHTPLEIEVAPMTIKGGITHLVLLGRCPQPLFYLAKGQILTQAIPIPAEVPVDEKEPEVY
ncbi:hypothetical protein TURU_008662 [Turdus rufiventris]|nr:hypothetical protein TURU_008662 [Turdus rufiventris]